MKSYLYNGKINDDFLVGVQTAINENIGNFEDICFIIESEGGYTDDKDAALFLLNNECKKRNVWLVAKNAIYSAAFDLFLGFNGPVHILPDTLSMAHLSTLNATVHSSGAPIDKDYLGLAKAEMLADIHERDLLMMEYLTDSEKADYIKGMEIFLSPKRTKSIIELHKAKAQ